MPRVSRVANENDTKIVVQWALNQLREDGQSVELEALLAFFANFVLENEVVRRIMRWDMAV